MSTPLRFEAGGNTYTFPTTVQTLNDNFKDVIGRVIRLPQADGGFDEFGSQKAPSAIGKVQFDFVITSETRTGMTALRDAMLQMINWGKGRLYKQPADTGENERWCFARVNNIQMTEDVAGQSDYWQKVSITFQASEPYWLDVGNATLWGGSTWGGFTWGGGAGDAVSGTSTTLTKTNNGDADTYPAISIGCGGAQTISTVTIRRIVNGAIHDQVQYNGGIGNNENVVIDARTLTVTKDGVDAYADFENLRGDWFRLKPGSNSIDVLLGGSGDAGTVGIAYFERFYN